ncbi:MAG: aminoglycoside adenylyltransferase domain-containing protein [Chloroflexota bacterium]
MEKFPAEISELLDALVGEFKTILQSNLTGIYLHGSLAMGCFNALRSDIDFLVVTQTKLETPSKQQMIDAILRLSERAPEKGFEFSVILRHDLENFRHPTPFELHYSAAWKARYEAGAVDFEAQQNDPDLAAHLMITRRRGICIYGHQPIAAVFPEIPADAYLNSILGDAEAILQNMSENPVYSMLNLCRVLAYKTDGVIASKSEGGAWALKYLDAQTLPLIAQALQEYESTSARQNTWSESELKAFAAQMRNLLKLSATTS